jgi:hypothetical protein
MMVDPTTYYDFLADLLVGFHFLYVMFVIFGLIFIVIGGILRWSFIRNPYFRVIHFLSILVVAAQAIMNVPCPLTVWENQLRELAGQTVEWDISFIGRLLRLLVFYDFPDWAFTVLHVSFASVVLLTLVIIPPRFKKTDY